MTRTLLDSGPLVAFFSTRDRHHHWTFEQMSTLTPPLLTCEPVLTEACLLLGRNGGDPVRILRALNEGIIEIGFQLAAEVGPLETLMRRYQDAPMSLADACLVRLSERETNCRVFTLDSDFKLYRRNGRQVIPLIAPW